MDEKKVIELVQAETELTEREISEFIHADWPEGDDHEEWLNTASDQEIADWVIAGATYE